MKLSICILPIAFATIALASQFELRLASGHFHDGELDQIFDNLAEQEKLVRSSRDLTWWNRYINHVHSVHPVNRRVTKTPSDGVNHLYRYLKKGNYSPKQIKEIIIAFNRLKAKQEKIRRQRMLKIMGY